MGARVAGLAAAWVVMAVSTRLGQNCRPFAIGAGHECFVPAGVAGLARIGRSGHGTASTGLPVRSACVGLRQKSIGQGQGLLAMAAPQRVLVGIC